tara:strand:+ start:249 stop:413 length:165 start_codon:yes stop_codon:yes gene_type:complete
MTRVKLRHENTLFLHLRLDATRWGYVQPTPRNCRPETSIAHYMVQRFNARKLGL